MVLLSKELVLKSIRSLPTIVPSKQMFEDLWLRHSFSDVSMYDGCCRFET